MERVHNGWSYNDDESYTFKIKCMACGYKNDDNYNDDDYEQEKFIRLEQTFISIEKGRYDYYEETHKHKLYICPMCGAVIAVTE